MITTPRKSIRTYCVSDLHAEAQSSMEWIARNCKRREEDGDSFTVLVIPGDIASDLECIKTVLTTAASNYDAVCYVPGNHEAWLRGESLVEGAGIESNSVTKLVEVLDCAKALGVHVGPLRVSTRERPGVVLMPLYAWYHGSWDTEPDLTHPLFEEAERKIPFGRKWSDFRMCRWPAELLSQEEFVRNDNTLLADAFADLNEPFLPARPSSSAAMVRPEDTLISFSHFLPRVELCAEKRFILEAGLTRVIGSDPLREQVRRLGPTLHLYGHTHIPMDIELDGTRYIQWPLGYRRESQLQCAPIFSSGPLLVHDTALGSAAEGIPRDIPSRSTKWSQYYRENPRQPGNTVDLAPWVLERLKRLSSYFQ